MPAHRAFNRKFGCVVIFPVLLIQGFPLSSEVAESMLSAW